jgi:hypothetical protein
MKLEPSSVKVAKNFSGACLTGKEYYFTPLPPFHEAVALERHRERDIDSRNFLCWPRFRMPVCIAIPKKAQSLDQVDQEQFNSNAAMMYLL